MLSLPFIYLKSVLFIFSPIVDFTKQPFFYNKLTNTFGVYSLLQLLSLIYLLPTFINYLQLFFANSPFFFFKSKSTSSHYSHETSSLLIFVLSFLLVTISLTFISFRYLYPITFLIFGISIVFKKKLFPPRFATFRLFKSSN